MKNLKLKIKNCGRYILILNFSFLILNCAVARAYVPGQFYHTGKTKDKIIALTFDDGPGRTTPAILELLKQHHIRATFFMLGDQVEEFPDIARQVVEAGHE